MNMNLQLILHMTPWAVAGLVLVVITVTVNIVIIPRIKNKKPSGKKRDRR